MEQLKELATIAPLVTALFALGALAFAALSFWFLTRDHLSRYRPYVYAQTALEPVPDSWKFFVEIQPVNVGSHPCEIRITGVTLSIGDESYSTQDMKSFLLLGQAANFRYPAGYVGEVGIRKIRGSQYKANRIELKFTIESKSLDGRYKDRTRYTHEINVEGDKPRVLTRPEWIERRP